MTAPMTFTEIGAELGVSPQRARQIFERAMQKVRAQARRDGAFGLLSPSVARDLEAEREQALREAEGRAHELAGRIPGSPEDFEACGGLGVRARGERRPRRSLSRPPIR